MSICQFVPMSSFLIYPYKQNYVVNRGLPLVEKTTADITLGVKSKLDNFTPKVTAAVVFSTKDIPLKTT